MNSVDAIILELYEYEQTLSKVCDLLKGCAAGLASTKLSSV